MEQKITYDYLKDNGLILFECIIGSQAYGTATPTSDIDKKFVYILPLDNIMGTEYVEQLNVTKDYTGWEIKRFLELMGSSNPSVLELFNTPEDCIITKHPLFDEILKYKNEFITKGCKNSFAGYAVQQITKAKGLNKKQNWEKDKVTRKELLDFIYVIEGEKSILWKTWNESKGFEEKFCGVVNVPNARDIYSVFFDRKAYSCFSESLPESIRNFNKDLCRGTSSSMGFGYKGLVKVGEGVSASESNQLRLSSIPKDEKPIATIIFNKDAYSQHCKDYSEYQTWLENRNITRYVETQEHGQKIDGKNMMHCMRLIRMAKEIGSGKGIQVRRDDREELLAIRRGEVNLPELIEMAEIEIKNMNEIFDNSDLPDSIDKDLVNKLLIDIRKSFYGIN